MAIRSFKTELNPNNKQATVLSQHSGSARFVYNWGLDLLNESFEQKKIDEQEHLAARQEDGEPEYTAAQLKEYRKSTRHHYLQPSAITLHKMWINKKNTECIWAKDVSKWACQNALFNLEDAYKRFFAMQKTEDYAKKNAKHIAKQLKRGKKSIPLGHPQFKKKNINDSFTVDAPVVVGDSWIQLPKIGKVRLFEKDYLPQGKPKSATISKKAGRWFVSVYYEVDMPTHSWTDEVIGVDFGVKTLMVCSDGTYIDPPNKAKELEDSLRRQQRKLARRQKGSKRREKTKEKIQKLYFRIANSRKDVLHKATTFLTKTKSEKVICIEDLNVSGMLKNHKLSKAIANVGLYEVRRQLEYKCRWYGKELVVADRFFPSSKIVNQTGEYNGDLKLSDRWIDLPDGTKICRDLNASYNLRDYGKQNTVRYAGINASGEGRCIVSSETRCPSMKLESNTNSTLVDFGKF